MSRYDVLSKRTAPPAPPENAEPVKVSGSRRGNPAYRQFSAYIPNDLYRHLKVRLAELDIDLSQAIEYAVTDWLQREKQAK